MKPEQMTEALEQVATQLGVRVRYETMTGETAGAGGLCKIKGQWAVIIDRRTPASDRAALLVEALAGFDTDGVYLPPQLREALQLKRAQLRGQPAADSPSTAGPASELPNS
jgi:hypothetical protein